MARSIDRLKASVTRLSTESMLPGSYIPYVSPILIVLLGLILPLPILINQSLHPDEALYMHWAQLISSGQDVMLNSVPVDKPPLFLYLLAQFFTWFGLSETVARLPSILAQIGTISLTFALGQQLYQRRVGLLAALIVVISPYHLLFTPTALTDPLLVLFIMLACWLAADHKPGWAGLSLGLAVATKQQGVLFLPLILGLILISHFRTFHSDPEHTRSKLVSDISRCLLIWVIVLIIPLVWDANRTYETGFWLQGNQSYGGLNLTGPHFWRRLVSFAQLLYLMTDSAPLNVIFGGGLFVLGVAGWQHKQSFSQYAPQTQADGLLIGFCLAYIVLHALLTFQIWDRYLLGLLPLLSLLLSRVLHLPEMLLKSRQVAVTVVAAVLVIAMMVSAVQTVLKGGYPLGGDRSSYHGAGEVATYLRGHAGANITLYHRWLGTHWRYYLFRFPYDLRFWQEPVVLAQQAEANAGGTQYIAFPSWQSTTPVTLALVDVGLRLKLTYRTYHPDSTPAIYLYQIQPIEQTLK